LPGGCRSISDCGEAALAEPQDQAEQHLDVYAHSIEHAYLAVQIAIGLLLQPGGEGALISAATAATSSTQRQIDWSVNTTGTAELL
jgi:hypothetical protein